MSTASLNVSYFIRKKLKRYHSIEEVFRSILGHLPSRINVQEVHVPFESSSLMKLIQNCFFARKHQAQLNHITGDIHYIALAFKEKTILTVHDIETLTRGNILRRLGIYLLWFCLPALKVVKIVAISEFTKKALTRVVPFAKQKIVVIPDPADPAPIPHFGL